MTVLASVQTAADSANPRWPIVLLLIAASLLVTALLLFPEIRDAWRRAKLTAPQPTVPRQLTDRNSRLPRQEHVQ